MEFQGYRVIQNEWEYEGLQVFRAYKLRTEQQVQIRLFPSVMGRFPLLLEKFRTNFNTLSQIQHPGICPIISHCTQGGQSYSILPNVVTGNLADRFRSGFHVGLDVSKVVNEIAAALDCAHQNGIIHGNLTAENVLIDQEGHVQIVGFGEAAILKALPSTARRDENKPTNFGPPEADIASKLSPATDQYSLALIALRLLTGLSVQESVEALASDIRKVQRRISREGKYSLDLSGQVLQVINRALAEKASKRFPSVAEFNHALQSALGAIVLPQPQVVPEATPIPVDYRQEKKKRSKLIAPILTGIAIFGVVTTIVFAQWGDLSEPTTPTEASEMNGGTIIELPDEPENSGLARDPNVQATPLPGGFGGNVKSSPTPTVGSFEGSPQPTSQPQSTNPTPSRATSTNPPSNTEIPTATETVSSTPSETPTSIPPTNTPEEPSIPTSTPIPPINPNSCKSDPGHRNYCTPTPSS